MTTHARPKPSAEGSFSRTPFAHILVYLYGKKSTGTLEARSSSDTVSIYFVDGMPAKVKSSFEGKGLGQILLDLGRISFEQLRECQREMTTTGGLAGEILMRRGVIDAPTLVRGLRGQMLLKLVDVFSMTDAAYAFFERVNLLVGDGPGELLAVDPYPVLMAGARAHGQRMRLDTVLDTIRGRWISLEDPQPLRRFLLTNNEQELCRELLAEASTIEKLISDKRHDLQMIRAVLYVLLITKQLAVSQTPPVAARASRLPKPPADLGSIAPPPVEAQSLDPEVRRAREVVIEKAARIANQNYYEMLEVPFGCPEEEVRRAFMALAKTYHPDRASREGFQDLKATLEYVFANLSEAHSTLLDPETRAEYGDAMSAGIKRTSVMPKAGADEVADVLEAEKLYQKALVLMRREQYAKGLALVDRARELNPKEGEYLAAWAKLQSLLRDPSAPIDDLVTHLRHAEELAPRSERVQLYLGQLLIRAQRMAEAQGHFRKVIDINPRNIEAARELRLMEMRKGREKEKKGIFDRFLK